jgi:hypothetical protein
MPGEVLQHFTRTRILNKPMNMQLLGDAQPRTERRVTDVAAADIAFISDRANDMTHFNTVIATHFNAIPTSVTSSCSLLTPPSNCRKGCRAKCCSTLLVPASIAPTI